MKRIITIALAVALASVATASASILVYENTFSHRGEYRDMKKLGDGKGCKKSWRDKKTLGFSLRGSAQCLLKSPVEGDDEQPNQIVETLGKVSKKTEKKARENAYIGVTVRASKREGYELRVYPKRRDWKFLRNGKKVEAGHTNKIGRVGRQNKLHISVQGSRVKLKANKQELLKYRDRKPKDVGGRQTGVTFGGKGKKVKIKGFFDNFKVAVPAP